jgi:hypothetical protein
MFTELLSGNALIKSITSCNNCLVLIFLAGMYYILSVNVLLSYIFFGGVLVHVILAVCSVCDCFTCMLLVPHFFKERAGGFLLSGVEFV